MQQHVMLEHVVLRSGVAEYTAAACSVAACNDVAFNAAACSAATCIATDGVLQPVMLQLGAQLIVVLHTTGHHESTTLNHGTQHTGQCGAVPQAAALPLSATPQCCKQVLLNE